MSAIRLGTAACVLQFQSLSASLSTGDDVAKDHLNSEALEDEHGRFRVWSGNLGALQKGHSSLDYRLRDSPLLETNILKLLDELRTNLSEALAVVSGSRLPYEKQAKADSDDEDDDWSQNEEDSDEDEESGSPKSELEQRFLDVVDIIDNLYKLSVRIRSPTLRSRSLKAASFRPVDPETGVDTFEQYAVFDAQYTRELLAHIRPPSEQDDSADDYLVERLSKAITLRRRQFKYWRRHRDKLGASTAAADVMLNSLLVTPDLTSPKTTPEDSTIKQEFTTTNPLPPSDWAPKSMLSGTEATQHHHSLDEIVDSQSVTSYATTTRDLTGHGIELPPPPTQAVEDRDFECPYCYIICPARYGRGRPWRTHLLQDLQPYVCTYEDCPLGDQLFRSRREWIEHEAGHRKLWRCPEHKDCVYRSSSGLEDHLHSAHLGIFPEDQIKSIVRVGETSSVDLRPKCPLCLADATMEGGLQNHIANHLERFAAFALPKDIDTAEDRSDGASSMASRGRSEAYSASQDLSDDDDEDEEEEPSEVDWDDADLQIPSGNLSSKIQQLSGKIEFLDMQSDEPRPRPTYSLSSDLLNLLPDSRTRNMDEFLASAEGLPDGLLAEIGQHRGDADATTPGSFPRSSRTARLVFEGLPHPLTGMLQQFLKARPGCRSMSSLTFSEEECSGYAKFTDNMSATNALEAIDVSQYPGVRFNIIKKLAPSTRFADFATIHEHVDNGDSDSDSGLAIKPQKGPAGDSVFAPGGPIKMQKGILPLTDIRTLQQLYADQWLPDHKPRSTPSEAFNHKISLIFKDITSLQVDAIVNASGRNLARSNSHLGRLVHKIAGPALKKELKDIKPFRTIGEAVITDAYNLPCKKIIHSVRPHYASSMDEVSQGLLAQCYRSALELAEQNQLRTIAFPTLSAGGFGFPSSKAATVAIETVRKYLDSGKGITLDRIVFCVFTERDWQAYWRLLPIFFPATSGSSSVPTWEVSNVPSTENTDLEVGPSTKELSTPYSQHRYPAYAKELGELQEQIEGISEDLIVFRDKVPDFQSNIIRELTFIASTVAELGKFFASFSAGPVNTMTDHRAADLLLICSVLRSYCGGITEIMMQTTYTRNVGVPTYADIWQSYTFHLANSQGLTPLGVVELCGNFIQSVADIIKWNGREPDDMGLLRDQLSRYRQKQTGSSIPDFPTTKVFDETLLAREFNAPESWKAPDSWEVKDKQTNILRANQIPTLSRLYQLGELDDTVPTMFSPSSHANNTLCLIRHDITRLQVDAIVNSTDMSCSGNGVLDAAIFKAGGLTMQEDCTKFGILKEGGVRLSQGYLLPCRHVIHTVPPEFYNNRTEPLLRSCYRDALKMAVDIGARTIAFPAIGSGLLMFPREAAQVGVVEMRNFLDQNPDTRIEKILICVFGEHEDNMYRKLLPQYFPPVDNNVNKAMPTMVIQDQSRERTESVTSPPIEIPSRGFMGATRKDTRGAQEGQKSVKFSRSPRARKSRPLDTVETWALDKFEAHAAECKDCHNPLEVYHTIGRLCTDGHRLSQEVVELLFIESGGDVYSTALESGHRVQVDLGAGYDQTKGLLRAMNESAQDVLSASFVNTNQIYTPHSMQEPPAWQSTPGGIGKTTKPTDEPSPFNQTGKGILRPPTAHFPDDQNPTKKLAAALELGTAKAIPTDARWTKIDRRLVNPQALEEAGEKFEERIESVVVLRVLKREEVQWLADRTQQIRFAREKAEEVGEMSPKSSKPNLERRGSLLAASKTLVDDVVCLTPINRSRVTPEALREANEEFEERLDVVVVHRDLSDAEISKLAMRTTELRNAKPAAFTIETVPQFAASSPTSALPPQPSIPTRHPRTSMASPHGLPGGYINEVKAAFEDRPDVVESFEQVLRDYRSGRIDSPGAVYWISRLFAEKPELIQGFNIFLPPGYRTEES